MICASCGRQVATGARYCIHCGAEQSVPTPIAAVAASMARRGAREAANAAHAEPAGRVDADAAREDAGYDPRAAFPAAAIAFAANAELPAQPAYAEGPPHRNLALALVGCLAIIAVAVLAYAAWRYEGARGGVAGSPDASATTAASPPLQAPAAAAESAPPVPGAATAPSSVDASSQAAAVPQASDANPVEIRQLPPHPAAAHGAHRAPAAKAAAPSAAETSEPLTTPPPAKAPAVAVARPESAAAAAHPTDRWQRLDDELSRCTREDFITRVICGQRVRFRYCDGYWGKVPQCPGNPTTYERGQ